MPVATGSKPSFRCQTCGHLVGSEHAGECVVPRACPVCRAGVRFHPDGQKTYQPDNWEVLAAATPERLAALGLAATDVAAHTPVAKEANVRAGIEVCQHNLALLAAKQAHWDAHQDALVAEFTQLDQRLTELDATIEGAQQDYPRWENLTHERARVWQRLHDLAGLEPDARDAESAAHLHAQLAQHEAFLTGHGATAPSRTLQLRARDGARARQQLR